MLDARALNEARAVDTEVELPPIARRLAPQVLPLKWPMACLFASCLTTLS